MLQWISVLIALNINAVVVDIILENYIEDARLSFLVSFVIVLAFSCLFLTPAGTWLMRVQNKLQKPSEMYRQRVDPIFYDVYERAKKRTPGLPEDIQWFILADDSLNALAVGRHTIGVHVGLLEHCTDDEIAAVLAHEFGHIAHWDTISTILTVESNFFIIYAKKIFVFAIKVIFTILGYILFFVDEEDFFSVLFTYAGKFLAWIFNGYLSIIYYICIIPSYAARRKQEYAADKYAAELRIRKPLIAFLSRFPSPPLSFSLSIVQMLYGTHPSNAKRIARLETYE